MKKGPHRPQSDPPPALLDITEVPAFLAASSVLAGLLRESLRSIQGLRPALRWDLFGGDADLVSRTLVRAHEAEDAARLLRTDLVQQ